MACIGAAGEEAGAAEPDDRRRPNDESPRALRRAGARRTGDVRGAAPGLGSGTSTAGAKAAALFVASSLLRGEADMTGVLGMGRDADAVAPPAAVPRGRSPTAAALVARTAASALALALDSCAALVAAARDATVGRTMGAGLGAAVS